MTSPESKHIRTTLIRDVPSTVPLTVQRQEWETAALKAELPDSTIIEPVVSDGVNCEWVWDAGADLSKVFLFVHGGGFNSGSSKTHRDLASRISRSTGIRVLLVDYRLAPEDPFPSGIEDVVTVYRWLVEQGVSPSAIVIGGDSAGANLTVAALLMLRESGDVLPTAAVLLSPWLDLTLSGETMTKNALIDPLTTREGLDAAVEYYAVGKDLADPLLSPIFANFSEMPPMLIQVGGDEVLLSDSMGIAKSAQEAGVEVKLEVWPEMWHTWHGWAATLPEAREAIDAIGQYVKGQL